MGPIEIVEKLINEHGSATVLKEHLGLLKAQISALETKVSDLELKNAQLKESLNEHKTRIRALDEQLHPSGNFCDHCGSSSLKRVGNRPNPIFKDLGVKDAVFRCNDCGYDSFFIIS